MGDFYLSTPLFITLTHPKQAKSQQFRTSRSLDVSSFPVTVGASSKWNIVCCVNFCCDRIALIDTKYQLLSRKYGIEVRIALARSLHDNNNNNGNNNATPGRQHFVGKLDNLSRRRLELPDSLG